MTKNRSPQWTILPSNMSNKSLLPVKPLLTVNCLSEHLAVRKIKCQCLESHHQQFAEFIIQHASPHNQKFTSHHHWLIHPRYRHRPVLQVSTLMTSTITRKMQKYATRHRQRNKLFDSATVWMLKSFNHSLLLNPHQCRLTSLQV
jgi:hypothetical protein